jgi:hypothetical protein
MLAPSRVRPRAAHVNQVRLLCTRARRGCQLSVWVAVSLEWKLQPPGLGWCRQGRDRPEELCLLCWGSLWVKAAKALASFVFVD